MLKKLLFTLSLTLAIVQAAPAQEPVDENVQTRLDEQEVIAQMTKTGRMPARERSRRIDSILKDPSGSRTPRSDFLFCTGLAYLGDYRGQMCLGSAYENGRGIVEDLSEAYVWYATALESVPSDPSVRHKLEADQDRVKMKLQSGYPAPGDDELEDLVKAQKSRIADCQKEIKKSKN